MPKTKLDKLAIPEIDWLRAVILERMAVKGITRKDLAKTANVCYETMREYFTYSPLDWPADVREAVCKRLGVKTIVEVGIDENTMF